METVDDVESFGEPVGSEARPGGLTTEQACAHTTSGSHQATAMAADASQRTYTIAVLPGDGIGLEV